jgi:hypothetical protein
MALERREVNAEIDAAYALETGYPFSLSPFCQPEGRRFETCLWGQTTFHCEFSALLVDHWGHRRKNGHYSREEPVSRRGPLG